MAEAAFRKSLAHTLRHTFGDILDLPVFAPEKNSGTHVASPTHALDRYAQGIRYCQDCALHIGRKNSVFGRGDWRSRIVFVGDFPSSGDDLEGEPFSDESGALLHKMILAMKLRPEETYLTNLFKCRPPLGQRIDSTHAQACEKHLISQFSHLKASMIIAMGDATARALARSESPLPVLRRQTFDWQGRKVICTWHPRDLLESPAKKKEAWDDLQRALRELGD
jgi:uracil-DNA glycosylase family 4